MAKTNLNAGLLRDILHNLDPENESHMKIYGQMRYYFIRGHEGESTFAYDDENQALVTDPSKVAGKITIGVGFNMDAQGAREIWSIALPEVDFDSARSGQKELSNDQIKRLFDISTSIRETELSNHYGSTFQNLRLNERLAIEDGYFNAPTIVRRGTNFHSHIAQYYATNDQHHLQNAVDELRHRSNKERSKGLQARRERQADMLSSFNSPFYSKPSDERLPYKKTQARVGITVIPRGIEDWPKSNDDRYFIWRTSCDGSVRESHLALEGKIFAYKNPPSIGLPGEDYNCRCHAETVPANIDVMEIKALGPLVYSRPIPLYAYDKSNNTSLYA